MSRPSIEQLAALAWNGSKADDDPLFHLCAQDHREKLVYHVQNVVKGGAITTPFDRAVRDALANPAKAVAAIAATPVRNDMYGYIVESAPEPIEITPETTVVAVEPTIAPPEPAKPAKTKKGK